MNSIEKEAREAGVTSFALKPLFLSELRSVLLHPFNTAENEQPEIKAKFYGKKVLVAEDNEMNQMIVVEILKDAGFNVEIANDGIEAVDKIKNASSDNFYDIVLMDVQMPNMGGYEATKQIRSLSDEKKANVPIIAVTANAFEEDRKLALDAGMNGHLAKPYNIPQIIETLSAIVK